MSFENHIQELENEFKLLQSNVIVADENWRDFVKDKFFNENLNNVPYEYIDFDNELNNMNQSFASAEGNINSLL